MMGRDRKLTCALTDVHICENHVVGWHGMRLDQKLCLLRTSLLFFEKSKVRNLFLSSRYSSIVCRGHLYFSATILFHIIFKLLAFRAPVSSNAFTLETATNDWHCRICCHDVCLNKVDNREGETRRGEMRKGKNWERSFLIGLC
jgi:hypothetical protein